MLSASRPCDATTVRGEKRSNIPSMASVATLALAFASRSARLVLTYPIVATAATSTESMAVAPASEATVRLRRAQRHRRSSAEAHLARIGWSSRKR